MHVTKETWSLPDCRPVSPSLNQVVYTILKIPHPIIKYFDRFHSASLILSIHPIHDLQEAFSEPNQSNTMGGRTLPFSLYHIANYRW